MQSGRYDRNHEHIKLKSPQNSCSWALICLQDNIRCHETVSGMVDIRRRPCGQAQDVFMRVLLVRQRTCGEGTLLLSLPLPSFCTLPGPFLSTIHRSGPCAFFLTEITPADFFLNLIYWGKTCILFTSPQVVLVCFISFHSCFLPVFRPSCFAMLWVSSFC